MANCLECGDKIIGRSDKKFCNDGCRNTYNNKLNRDSSALMKTIHKKLRNNYKILADLKFVDGKIKIKQDKITSEGFDYDYFTQVKSYKNGAEYRFLYDIGYKILDDGNLLVVKTES
ncbi:hypothetical protein [Moheibacter stercoris]|uniref:DUF2116 family Zn-ribbon domain-containing protein n=1 Tax=Moheibacter stercoris TaxID=1628251 RepID=A0ABV2LW17_9FLAO